MTLRLTPEVLRAAYDYLACTDPFRKWNLPDSDDVTFRVTRSRKDCGWYLPDGDKHIIAVSSRLNGFTDSVIRTVAHEMAHVHLYLIGVPTWRSHEVAFGKVAAQICRAHGYDPQAF